MADLPPVSIIVPAYKRVEQTKKTISLLYQSRGWQSEYQPEVIVADSTEDESLKKIISDFQNPEIIYTRPERAGIAANKNAGAHTAKNELLIFCDSDMEMESDTLINTLTYLKEHQSVAMAGGQVIWRGGEKDGDLDRPRKEDRLEIIEGVVYIEAIYSRYMATYKSLFESTGGYDEELFNMRGEGSDLSIRYWRAGLPLGYSDKIIVHHVHEAADAATRHIDHPERGIIRDLIQLAYIYGSSSGESPNFAKTLSWITDEFHDRDKYIVIESVISLLPYFWEVREKLVKARKSAGALYDFKFLDVFTQKELFLDCISHARVRIKQAREKAFGL